ncbi:hypothetical protein [Ruegeria sp. HKCCD7318]|uniref:hypothetical protein n=1 Tax=Ruegeria sp. HKCCD7318 TaxID=2683014 RepID=UPI001C125635|nr:hypothetical protein [Ruegeria sp. HKCCD7318]
MMDSPWTWYSTAWSFTPAQLGKGAVYVGGGDLFVRFGSNQVAPSGRLFAVPYGSLFGDLTNRQPILDPAQPTRL